MECENCKKTITEKVSEYSTKNYGKMLCMDCQKIEKDNPTNKVPVEYIKDDKERSTNSNEHIITLNGKKYITHAGLLNAAHLAGLKGIETELLTESTSEVAVCKATVYMKRDEEKIARKFTAYGDACKDNVNKNILPHILRMAETRSVNRALRFATNIGMCSVEELSENEYVNRRM